MSNSTLEYHQSYQTHVANVVFNIIFTKLAEPQEETKESCVEFSVYKNRIYTILSINTILQICINIKLKLKYFTSILNFSGL